MTPSYPQVLWITVTLAGLVCPFSARADVVVAPAGGAAIPALPGHVVCKDGTDLRGWTVEGDGTRIRPPATPSDVPAQFRMAPATNQCANSNTMLHAVAAGDWPVIDPASVILNVDAGRLDVRGRNLRGAVLRWQSGSRSGSDACRDPQPVSGGETCALALDRDLSADPAVTTVNFYPPGVAGDGDVLVYDAQGRALRGDAVHMVPARVLVLSLLPIDAAVAADTEVSRLTLRHPEAVGSVECADAICELDGNEISVRGEHGNDETLDMRLHLRPHVYLQGVSQLDPAPAMQLPLQRCPVSVVSAAPLRGIASQNLVVRVGGKCQKDTTLRFTVSGGATRLLNTINDGDSTYAVIRTDRLGGDEFSVTVQRGGQVVGIARGHTRVPPVIHARLELPGYGPIDFIPTNREAAVVLPSVGEGTLLVPLPVDGVYTVTRSAGGADRVRGLEGTTGWVALRLGYRDKTLPAPLRDVNLAEITDAVDRSIKPANLPVTLAATGADPLVELLCDGADDLPKRMTPGTVNHIDYAHRDSCHLVLHRERLLPEDGEQTVRVTASVATADGVVRSESALDTTVRLRPGPAPRLVYVGGVLAPFDRVVVRTALVADDTHYAVSSEERQGAPPLQWSVIMGSNRLRFYATTSFPTGLFRVADAGHSGILGLNGGILFRVVALNDEGLQTPLGLETGVMWMGIAGDKTQSTYGQMAIVGGLGISVPIANLARVTQASISLHIWAEYEVSRAVLHQDGNPWGFVFGPSLSVGNVGMNL